MPKQVSYKAIVIVAGILVALAVVVALWMDFEALRAAYQDRLLTPEVAVMKSRQAVTSLLEKVSL